MKKQNWLLIVAVILLSALPLWFAPPGVSEISRT